LETLGLKIGILLVGLITASPVFGQHGSNTSSTTGPSASNAAPTSSTLQGISFEQVSWPQLTLPPFAQKQRAVSCYKLTYGMGTSQPFVLVPVQPSFDRKTDPANQPLEWQGFYRWYPTDGKTTDPQETKQYKSAESHDKPWTPCTVFGEKNPLLMGQTLIVGVDVTDVDVSRLRILNLNVTNQQGSPINNTPVRASFNNSGTGSTSANYGMNLRSRVSGVEPKARTVYFLTWRNLLPGDTIPTISVNAIYTPPVPAEQWTAKTFYPVGSVVTATARNGHYYVALKGGLSSNAEPAFPVSIVPSIQDGHVLWVDAGPTAASSGSGAKTPPGIWISNHPYAQGESVLNPYNGHVYVSTSPGSSMSGDRTMEPFSLPIPANGLSQTALPADSINDGSLVWKWDQQTSNIACTGLGHTWTPNSQFHVNSAVGPYNARCYVAAGEGMSGPTPAQPYFPANATLTIKEASGLTWQDVGTSAPATVTGAQATDQAVGLLNLQLPQVHSLSYYNLAAGVVYSTVHSRSFGVPPGGSAMTPISTNAEIETSSTPTIDPVLLLTVYPWPVDAETRCGFKCIWKTYPGLSVGLSLANPSSSFYVGTSVEIFRNMQLVLGANVAKESSLPKPAVQIPGNATTAVTSQRFSTGPFIGLTFNISGFVQGLFGGGGSGGSTKASSTGQ
jgi:hypothetical protein